MSVKQPNKTESRTLRTIRVGALARVEGEGALHLEMDGDMVREARLEIYEPPRFFEAFLRGRSYQEVPDITARICGICPVAYQMGACHALEKAFGAFDDVDPAIRRMRDLLYCGEWIESHVLHMFMLHLPDFLGFESALTMAQQHGETVQRALRIKKYGNDLIELLGGRAVHPIGACVGGFYRAPETAAAHALIPETEACLEDMCALTTALAELVDVPDLEQDYEFLSVCPDDQYPMNLGRIKSNKGLDIDQDEFLDAVEEEQTEHSTALRARVLGRGFYLVGPLARLNLCSEQLHPRAAEVLEQVCRTIDRPLPWRNTFLSLHARGVETVHALALALDLLKAYRRPERSRIPLTPRRGAGGHGTEAPRGLCWHRYETDDEGMIRSARIIPPTSQNQGVIEQDLRALGAQVVDMPDEQAALRCEHLIRNYDPCISCSVHWLKFTRSWS
ncbi:MAG: Ni/Fe hydrogenase subunit alpha [Planctomycetaceae bacterium]|nr:Ni/Fe hydrogenase subunit alpha [Planctomycetaceae bacterium]